jgi:hypothetical protein
MTPNGREGEHLSDAGLHIRNFVLGVFWPT